MNTLALAQLDAQLASILKRIRSLQHLNLAIEAEHQHALDESRRLLGAIASYRHRLEQAALSNTSYLRYAA